MNPIARGSLLAIVAAVLFGITTPIVKRAGADTGTFMTAGLLYAGAALATVRWGANAGPAEAPLRHHHAGRVLAVALLGAVIAPAAFAWGLKYTSGTSAALLLNMEAAFTVVLGWRLYGEWIGPRVSVAVLLMLLAGGILAMTGSHQGGVGWGAGSVALATFAWALDNALTRPLADLDPVHVVRWKAGLGAGLSFVLSMVMGEGLPQLAHAGTLLGCGVTGFGLSLRLYLLAQRRIGAGRTGSIFALAPFIGAGIAWAIGERAGGPSTLAAAGLFVIAVVLHVTEKHAHRHKHERIEHEHAHRHDDGHHDHRHEPAVVGEHSHVHLHDEREHEHLHGPDAHHVHRHGVLS